MPAPPAHPRSASEQIRYSGSGQFSARLMSVCDGSAGLLVWEW